ncbi:mercuric reductase [Phaeosphaeria sp. MPI-PUGE-AT-0046c]|nr:mercuric reductase [Phaeosphaeria sp. MPI-PUGE-AT-0046c]
MSKPTHYNAVILGSGQAGTPLATHIKSLGQSVCLIERSHIAGCCVNEGCTPTKTMVASGRMAYLARRMGEYGVDTGNGKEVKVDMQKVRQRKRDIVDSFRGGSERRLKNAGVDVLMGEARFVGEKVVEVVKDGQEEGRRVSADKIFVNVGCRPARPNIPGLENVDHERVLDSTSIQELGDIPEHLVVVGGGVIGLEFGQLFRRLGAKVTILQRGAKLLSRSDDPELADCMQDILEEDEIEILLDTKVDSISKTEDEKLPIEITTGNSSTKALRASHILLATGRVPNTDTMNLQAANITTTPSGFIQVSPTLETSTKDIYALGDVKGGPAFTHVSYDDFRIVRENLFSPTRTPSQSFRTTSTRDPFIPSVTYTDPQFAHIGPRLLDLPSSKSYISYSMPASWIARGLETDETRGMLKAVVDAETDKIVSFSAIAVEGGEIMSVVQMAMLGGLRWMDLRDGVFAHPAWSESLNNLWGGESKEIKGNM